MAYFFRKKYYFLFFLLLVSASAVFYGAVKAQDGRSPDAIALRVVPNPENMSAILWYQRQGFSGSPQELTVDGYRAVRDGRTVYVNAANINDQGTANTGDDRFFTNIYIISHNQNPEKDTRDIFASILKGWRFNANVEGNGSCSNDPERYCLRDRDCGSEGYCLNILSRIRRDTARLEDFFYLNELISAYFEENRSYPGLKSGTYIPGASLSVWPSWKNSLTQHLNKQLPVDPVNKLGPCCPEAGEFCDPSVEYNEITCWSESDRSFAGEIPEELPYGSLAYAYRFATTSYELCANFESGYADLLPQNCSSGFMFNNPPRFLGAGLSGWPYQPFAGNIGAVDPDGDPIQWALELLEPSDPSGWEALGWDWGGASGFGQEVLNEGISSLRLAALSSGQASTPGMYRIRATIDDGRGRPNSTLSREFDVNIGHYDLTLNSNSGEILIGEAIDLDLSGTNSSGDVYIGSLQFDSASSSRLDSIGLAELADHGFAISGLSIWGEFPDNDIQQTGTYQINVYIENPATRDRAEASAFVSIVNHPPGIISVQGAYRDNTRKTCLAQSREECRFIIDNGENAEITVSAFEPDGHNLYFELAESLPGLSIDNNGVITGLENLYPESPDLNEAHVTVRAFDQYCANSQPEECSTSTSFVVEVMPFCSVDPGHPAYINAAQGDSEAEFVMINNQIGTYDFMQSIGLPPDDSCSAIGNASVDITRTNHQTSKAIVFVVDTSGSMSTSTPGPQAIDQAKAAVSGQIEELHEYASGLLDQGINLDLRIGLIRYSDDAETIGCSPPYYCFDNSGICEASLNSCLVSAASGPDTDNLTDDIDDWTASGNTNTFEALNMAMRILDASGADEKNIVLLTDGAPQIRWEYNCNSGCYNPACCHSDCEDGSCVCEDDPPCSCSGGGGGSGSVGTRDAIDQKAYDFKVAVTYTDVQGADYEECEDVPCPEPDCPGLCNSPWTSTNWVNDCSIRNVTSVLAEDIKNYYGQIIYSVYFNTGEEDWQATRELMCDWSSDENCECSNESNCGGNYAFTAAGEDSLGSIYNRIVGDLLSIPTNVFVNNGIFPDFDYDSETAVTEEILSSWDGLDSLFSCRQGRPLYVRYDGLGAVVVDNIVFEYCEPLLHPLDINYCSTAPGCQEGLDNTEPSAGYCDWGQCAQCVDGYFWNGTECVFGCQPDCQTAPGCRPYLANGEAAASGECCSNTCYECRENFQWNETLQLCVPQCDGTYYVNPDGSADYETIREAVWGSCDGATIVVRDGEYAESVVVDKELVIISENGPDNVRVRGVGGHTFTVRSDNARIEGLGISSWSGSGRSAVFLEEAENAAIVNNQIGFSEIENAENGIYIMGGGNNTISNNIISHMEDAGIYVLSSQNNNISGNTLAGNDRGLFVEESGAQAALSPNHYDANQTAVSLSRSGGNTLSGNTFSGQGRYGFFVSESDNTAISGHSSISGFIYGIGLDNSDNCRIANNSIVNNTWDGVYLQNCSNTEIIGNDISHNRRVNNEGLFTGGFGIDMRSGTGNAISGNTINGNGKYGIHVYSQDVIIEGNTINGNGFFGLFAHGSGFEVSGNTVFGTGDLPVYINSYSDPSAGMRMHSHNTRIEGNTVSGSSDYGIMADNGHWSRPRLEGVYLSDNTISGARTCLNLHFAEDVSLENNSLENCAQLGMANSSIINGLFVDNTIDGPANFYSLINCEYYGNLFNGPANMRSISMSRFYRNQFSGEIWLYNVNSSTSWSSPEPVGYNYGGSNYASYMGNYYLQNNNPDEDGNGISDTAFELPGSYGYHPPAVDEYPLAAGLEEYD